MRGTLGESTFRVRRGFVGSVSERSSKTPDADADADASRRAKQKKQKPFSISPDRVRPSPILPFEMCRVLDHREALVSVVREPEEHADADVVEPGPHRSVVGEQTVVVVRFRPTNVLFFECRAMIRFLEEGVGPCCFLWKGEKKKRERENENVCERERESEREF
jgi:hypothetical protein